MSSAASSLLTMGFATAQSSLPANCKGHIYLTLDTGNMRDAEAIAATLRKHQVKATFFLAQEKTPQGDSALDASWASYWRARVQEGHAFGSHTWRHGKILSDLPQGAIRYRPQFGEGAGQPLALTAQQFCDELQQVDRVFKAMTGRALDPFWRAPGGRTSNNALSAAQRCGYTHVYWAEAGFLGDELPSEHYPNKKLLMHALKNIADGDVLMAHLGIWSRKESFAPMFDPLISGLKERGFCFLTLTAHPQLKKESTPIELKVSAKETQKNLTSRQGLPPSTERQ